MPLSRSRIQRRTNRRKNNWKLFEVEGITEKRIVIQYRVKWKGYRKTTWVDRNVLISTCRDLIETFEVKKSSQKKNPSNFELSEINRANSEHTTMNPILSFAEEVAVDPPSTSDTCNGANREESSELKSSNFNSSSMFVEANTLPECNNDEDSINRKNFEDMEDDANEVKKSDRFLQNLPNGHQSESGYTWHKIKTLVDEFMGLAGVLESGKLKIEEINLQDRSKILGLTKLMDGDCELKILGGTDEGGLKILLELKNQRTGERILDFIPTARVRAIIPQLLIAYYEKHLKFVVTTN